MSHLVPKPSPCIECKGGRVGMAMCEACAGSGTVFKIIRNYQTKIFPDTREGYTAAERELNQ